MFVSLVVLNAINAVLGIIGATVAGNMLVRFSSTGCPSDNIDCNYGPEAVKVSRPQA
jgi:hypothetical protein